MRYTAPWPDFVGHPVMDGDRIVHPSGEWGFVTFFPDEVDDDTRWQVDYGHGVFRRLHPEVGETGRGVVLDESGKVF